jgi:hypothetical protein
VTDFHGDAFPKVTASSGDVLPSCPPGSRRAPYAEYNCAILTKKPLMEAEKINALASSLADLGERAREMRRYL